MAKEKVSNFSAVIRESSRELSAKERVMYKDLSNATSLVDYELMMERQQLTMQSTLL